MKKLLAIILIALLVLSLTACESLLNNSKLDEFNKNLPKFETAMITTGNNDSTWNLPIESYEIIDSFIYIHGTNGITVLVDKSNCVLVNLKNLTTTTTTTKVTTK